MSGQLYSLTDVLKKTLFFFDFLTVSELTSYVHQQMLGDYQDQQVEDKVGLCLKQQPCFVSHDGYIWKLNLEGKSENEGFYNTLVKKQTPLNFKELAHINKKKNKQTMAAQAVLIGDGRFIQMANGLWGLTEWAVEASQYSLKHLLIKALKAHAAGLSVNQLTEIINSWKKTNAMELLGVLQKYPYFEQIGDQVWSYNFKAKILYDSILKRYLTTLKRQRDRWQLERNHWQDQIKTLKQQLMEVEGAQRETAAALALRKNEAYKVEQITTQMAEKDLLLALRKKEIYRYREHLQKLEAKANSILYQCRLWVQRAKVNAAEKENLADTLQKKQQDLEFMFTKLQQYKERERENKALMLETKETHGDQVAALQTEIINLKQKFDKMQQEKSREIKVWQDETNALSVDLKQSMEENERLNRSLRVNQQELIKWKDQYKTLMSVLNQPLIKFMIKITGKFKKTYSHTV